MQLIKHGMNFRKITINALLLIYLSLFACGQERTKLSCNTSSDYLDASVYKPCNEFIFKSKYWFKGELISDEEVSIFITGNRWEYESSQVEALHIYRSEIDENTIEKIRSFGINNEINDRDWVKQSKTGIIDNQTMIFLHPFRDNQYYFTEIAPFPEIFYPLYAGKKWSVALNIGEGWGIWNGQRLETSYEILDSESVTINGKIMNNCWKISSNAISDFGVSYLTMWFHEEFGFVKLNYVTYASQNLQLELVEIISH